MKKHFALGLAMLLAASALAGCSGSSGASAGGEAKTEEAGKNAASEYKFTVSNFYAAVNNHGLLGEAWCNEITERTDGKVTFEYYPGASLVADNGSYDAIKNGIVDIAMFSTASTPGVFPAMSLLELPQGYENGWVGTKVANDFVKEFELAEFSDVEPLYIHTVSPLVILSNKEVKTVNDFNGMIIRSGSELATKTTTALKGQAYSCQITELYEALTKGMCDAAISGTDTLTGFNLAEVVKYVYPDASYGKVAAVATCMNKKKWEALPDDIKQVFEEVSAEYADQQGRCWMYEDAVGLSKFETENGGQVITFDEDMHSQLTEMLEPVNEEFIAGLNLDAAKVEEYKAFLTEKIAYYNDNIPAEDEILAWGEETLTALQQ